MAKINKSRTGVQPGLVCIKTTYDVPSRSGQKAYKVTRDNWVLPQTARELMASGKDVKLNDEKMSEKGITMPSPVDTTRVHTHEGDTRPHPVTEVHQDAMTSAAHNSELGKYWEFAFTGDDDKQHERLHAHSGAEHSHPVLEVHDDEDTRVAHQDEKISFDNALHGRESQTAWLDKYHVEFKAVYTMLDGKRLDGMKYWNDANRPVYVFEQENGTIMAYTKEKGIKLFSGKRPMVDAMEYAKPLLESTFIKKSFDDMRMFRKAVIQKISILTNSDPSGMTNQSIVYNKYSSGDNAVTLGGIDGHYSVAANGTPMINTDDFSRAISKYYQKISDLIEANTDDKDVSLGIFGDKLLQVNRQIRPLIEKLGDEKAKSFFDSFDSTGITFPFDEQLFLKQTQQDVVIASNPPYQEEMGQGPSNPGQLRPSRGDLKPGDYKNKKAGIPECQQVIDEEGNDARAIQPAIVMH